MIGTRPDAFEQSAIPLSRRCYDIAVQKAYQYCASVLTLLAGEPTVQLSATSQDVVPLGL
jgi:hypothetical protein